MLARDGTTEVDWDCVSDQYRPSAVKLTCTALAV